MPEQRAEAEETEEGGGGGLILVKDTLVCTSLAGQPLHKREGSGQLRIMSLCCRVSSG